MEGVVLEIINNGDHSIATIGYIEAGDLAVKDFYITDARLELLDLVAVDKTIKKKYSFSSLTKSIIEKKRILSIVCSYQLYLIRNGQFNHNDDLRTYNWGVLMKKYYEQITKTR